MSNAFKSRHSPHADLRVSTIDRGRVHNPCTNGQDVSGVFPTLAARLDSLTGRDDHAATCDHGLTADQICTSCAVATGYGEKVCVHVSCHAPATDRAYGMDWCRGHLFAAHQWRMSA
jgi:hypothetical protein